MSQDVTDIVKLWKEEACNHIQKYAPYHASDQLKRMAAIFTPGHFYYYIINFHNLEMEYVHENVKNVLGIAAEDYNIQRLLKALPPDELVLMEKKEALIADFLFRFLSPEEILDYKIIYFLRMMDTKGNSHLILHQATTLTVSESGKVEHVLGIHTDVSHLGMFKNNTVSFLSLSGRNSYFNLDPEKGKFNPEDGNSNSPKLSDVLTKREIEVAKLVAMGLNSQKIAEELIVSLHTIRTHRKNILKKTRCLNTSELVAKCLIEGLV